MVNYNCPRCNYTTNRKCNFKYHLNRKKKCPPEFSDTSILDIANFYKISITNDFSNHAKVIPQISSFSASKNTHFIPKNIPTTSSLKLEKNKCKFCNKYFSSYKNCWRHEKNNCKVKKQIIVKQELKQINNIKTINNNNNNNNNNNTTNNIVINNFFDNSNDQKIYERLSNKTNLKLLNKLSYDDLISVMLQKIYFDEEHPENRNISCTNLQSKLCDVFTNNTFKKVCKKKAYEIISDKVSFAIQDLGENYEDKLNYKGKKNNYLSIENLSNPLEKYDVINAELYNNTKQMNI